MHVHFYSYRSREEIKEVKKERDPIDTFKEKIIAAGLVTKEELKVYYQCMRGVP